MLTELSSFELTSTAPGEAPAADAQWLPALVPGGVHESLLAAGRIAHPYFGDHEASVRWVEDRSWWYRTEFEATEGLAADERVVLSLEGLDTVAQLWLNGVELGRHANQHRPFTRDVTGRLQGRNELLIRIDPPLSGVLTDEQAQEVAEVMRARDRALRPGAPEKTLAELVLPASRSRRRKATFSWGWDFAPRIPSVGLTGRVSLRRERLAQVSGVAFRTTTLDLAAGTAQARVTVDLDCFAGTPDEVAVVLTAPGGERTEVVRPGGPTVHLDLAVQDVRPWWTHDLGDQPLYGLRVELRHGGAVLDAAERRVGIRTVELDRSADEQEGGRLFRFVLNGQPVFARGANWVPASTLVGSVSDDRYRELLTLARDGQMTMLRVWGGGIYEPAVFYDTCDELGLLVWQDFMFACFDYPTEDPAFVEEVAQEAAYQVKRLRHHACLALWCGENEVQAIHQWTFGNVEPGEWGSRLFHEVLPEAVATHDPGAIYWPGSPWGAATDEVLNGVSDGDRHAWEVWHGLDLGAGGPSEFASRGEAVHFHRYAHDHGRFISEFGIHASPALQTLERWTPPGSLELRSQAFDQRNKDTPKDKGFALLERETGLPTTLAEYVTFSMAAQAEGLKFGVEHYRRRQPHCSGTLVWQLNDVWPGFSWSVIDHDLVPKAGYYFLKRAYQPVLASFRPTGSGLELWATNSTADPVELDLVVEIADLRSGPVETAKVQVHVPAHASAVVWDSPVRPTPEQVAWVSCPSGAVEPNRMFFAALKDLPLGDGQVAARAVRTSASSAEVTLEASGYCYFTHLACQHPGLRLDADYLDLRAGDCRTVRVNGLRADTELTVAVFAQAPVPVRIEQ